MSLLSFVLSPYLSTHNQPSTFIFIYLRYIHLSSYLSRIMALFVSSHYKNSPNDLQMLSDAPAHHLFCLLPPISETSTSLPEVSANHGCTMSKRFVQFLKHIHYIKNGKDFSDNTNQVRFLIEAIILIKLLSSLLRSGAY